MTVLCMLDKRMLSDNVFWIQNHKRLLSLMIESEIETVLVLSGITSRDELRLFPYKPHYVFNDVSEICS